LPQGLTDPDRFGLAPKCDGSEEERLKASSRTGNWDFTCRAGIKAVAGAIKFDVATLAKAARTKGILNTVWEESRNANSRRGCEGEIA
jgi:hypothetical protein